MAGGRPEEYSQEIADRICESLANGKSLNRLCKLDEYPSQSAVYSWLSKHDDFAEKYARAREKQADFYAQEIVDIGDEQSEVVTEDGRKFDPDVNRDRLRIDARKWFASKVAPKKYGDKQAIELTGSLKVSELTDADLEKIASSAK